TGNADFRGYLEANDPSLVNLVGGDYTGTNGATGIPTGVNATALQALVAPPSNAPAGATWGGTNDQNSASGTQNILDQLNSLYNTYSTDYNAGALTPSSPTTS